jgi:Domain of unknown function (DUF4402)
VGKVYRLVRSFGNALIALGASLLGTGAAQAASATSNGEAVIVSTLSFLSAEDLEFGSIVAGTTGGTVIINPNGTRTVSGVVTASGLNQPARFAGRGTVGQTVQISMVATPINITRVGGTETMQVSAFRVGTTTSAVLISTTPLSFVIGSGTGIFNFPVGATLTVNPNQAEGNYQGTFSIILNYM